MDFLHSHRIVHRDLKPQNLLVTKDNVVKLTDFGLARIYEFYTLLTSVVVTLWYRSPEVLMGLSYATPVDMWSCGCIFAELFLRKALFPGQYEMDQLSTIFDVIGTPSEAEWPEKAGITRSNFKESPPKNWKEIVPEMDPQAQDLVQVSSFEKNIDPPNPIYSDISCILPSLDLHLLSFSMHLTLILFHISVIFALDPILSLHLMHLTLF